jgi:hypothetical protein
MAGPYRPQRPDTSSIMKAMAGQRIGKIKSGGGRRLAQRNTRGRVRSSGGGRVRANSSGQYGATPPVPASAPGNMNDINAYLGGDSGYQDQLRQLAKALGDFNADVGRRKGTLESEYGLSKKALGDQKVKDLESLEEDYASRGLLRSGVYGSAVGDYNKEFGERMSDLDRRQQQALQLLLQEQSQYGQQNTLEQQRAREEAIRRRAEQYGV